MDLIKNLLIFILSLGVLVLIHELGHFITAKIFNVYCREFSIGMGPLLFKIKKPEWETQYSIRMLPVGGFVSMVGEDAGDNEGSGGYIDPSKKLEENLTEEDRKILDLPKERRLDGIARWKRLIIMSAGVIMNVILGFCLFIGQGATGLVANENANYLYVNKSVENGYFQSQNYEGNPILSGSVIIIIDGKEEVNVNKQVESVVQVNELIYGYLNKYTPTTENDVISYVFVCEKNDNSTFNVEFSINTIKNDNDSYSFDTSKLDIKIPGRKRTFREVITFAFETTGESAILIYKGLASLFTPSGLDNVGGPIAMFKMSSQAVSYGISTYLYLWGVISINLAVMNFLPFPGLDGWHFVVLIVESITRKEFPSKIKNIISMIGLLLLFSLMILITFKDIFFPVI